METLALSKVAHAAGTMTVPGSKSISNRALLLAALADGKTHLKGLLDSDDVRYMTEALLTLGIQIERISPTECIIEGNQGHLPTKEAELFLGNAGTAFRSLTAALALNQGHYVLRGIPRMHERPIKDLVEALQSMGLMIHYLDNEGYPPLEIFDAQVMQDEVSVKGSVSSQFLTALLLTIPMTKKAMTIHIDGELISKPYITITLAMLKDFGIVVENRNWQSFYIPAGQTYQAVDEYYVEGDASSASYFAALGAIGGEMTLQGIGTQTIQGDVEFLRALEMMGVEVEWHDNHVVVTRPASGLRAIDLDCNHIPDAAMTLAVLALFAKGTTTLRNIGSWRVKETDRIHAMATELTKLGAIVEEGEDYLVITPVDQLNENVSIGTYDDHRMAMCFSLCSFLVPVIIEDPACVNKTFPTYFTEFKALVR